MRLIETNKAFISTICRQHGVKALYVFGSVLTPRFCANSDVDLVVDFHNGIEDYVSNYFNLKEALERLFNRKVDLLEAKGIRNPVFKANVERTAEQIYG